MNRYTRFLVVAALVLCAAGAMAAITQTVKLAPYGNGLLLANGTAVVSCSDNGTSSIDLRVSDLPSGVYDVVLLGHGRTSQTIGTVQTDGSGSATQIFQLAECASAGFDHIQVSRNGHPILDGAMANTRAPF